MLTIYLTIHPSPTNYLTIFLQDMSKSNSDIDEDIMMSLLSDLPEFQPPEVINNYIEEEKKEVLTIELKKRISREKANLDKFVKKDKFNLCAKTLFLTYPKCPMEPIKALEYLIGLVEEKCELKNYIIA